MKNYSSLSEIQRDISTGLLSCCDLVDFYLQQIQTQAHLNLFLEVYETEARQKAIEIDQKIRNGTAGSLAGLVIGIKDVICYRDHRLGAASKMLDNFESLMTATALERLLEADVIVIGRQNCDEFGMGSSTENSAYGPALNPMDPQRVPGGSSGASAAAVKANMCHASLGSDTGGSVRQPAAFCGVVGLKPSYGRISRWGLIAYASSFDQIGPITRSVEDAAILLKHMAGPDPKDNTSSQVAVGDYVGKLKQRERLTIGYIREAVESEGLDPEIKSLCFEWIQKLKAAGHRVEAVEFPLLPYIVPCYYILTTAEASSNLSRYDGVHFGHRSARKGDLPDLYRFSRSEGFGEEVKRRIMLGTFVLSAGHYDAYFNRAMQVRQLIRQSTRKIMETCDLILTPTAPSVAFRLGKKSHDPVSMYLEDIYTVHANLAGIPAVSLPLGQHSNGMPIGIQLMGRDFEEEKLLGFADYLMENPS